MTGSKAAIIERHRFLCLVVALALVTATVMSLAVPRVVRAAESEGITCNFTIGNQAPAITEVGLYNATQSETVTAMNPQVEYSIKVTVADNNTLDDLALVEVTIFWDEDSDDSTEDAHERQPHTKKAFKMICTVGGPNGTWIQQPGSGTTTWDIVEDNCKQPSLGGPIGDFWFNFKPGKVATEDNDWDIYVEVKDESNPPGTDDTEYHAGDYDMLWYGEIDVETASVDWGSVAPGMDFSDNSAKQTVSVKYISNGDYDAAVTASANWNSATLNTGGNPAPQEFSLKAWSSDNVNDAKLVTTNASNCVIVNDGSQTEEGGFMNSNNHVYLRLGTPFIDGTYSGTITFHIRNR